MEKKYKDFVITSVAREDLESIDFNTQDVDDSTMEHLASKMADAYCDNGFWIDLPILAEHLGIPKHNAEPLKCVADDCNELQGEDGEYCEAHTSRKLKVKHE